MAEQPVTQAQVEESFRDSLRDLIVVVKKLAPHCNSLEDLLGMAELALTNNGQLHFIMSEVQPRQLRS